MITEDFYCKLFSTGRPPHEDSLALQSTLRVMRNPLSQERLPYNEEDVEDGYDTRYLQPEWNALPSGNEKESRWSQANLGATSNRESTRHQELFISDGASNNSSSINEIPPLSNNPLSTEENSGLSAQNNNPLSQNNYPIFPRDNFPTFYQNNDQSISEDNNPLQNSDAFLHDSRESPFIRRGSENEQFLNKFNPHQTPFINGRPDYLQNHQELHSGQNANRKAFKNNDDPNNATISNPDIISHDQRLYHPFQPNNVNEENRQQYFGHANFVDNPPRLNNYPRLNNGLYENAPLSNFYQFPILTKKMFPSNSMENTR